MNRWYVALAAGVIAIGVGCGSSSPNEDDAKRLDKQVTSSTKATPKTSFGEGTYELGAKLDYEAGTIVPGTYVITTASSGLNCYWSRVKSFDGELTSIIANGNISPNEVSRVEVKKTDKGLVLNGECIAKKK